MRQPGFRDSNGQSDDEQPFLVRYHEDDYMEFVKQLYHRFPGHWFAILITKRDAATGITEGRVLAHNFNSDIVAMTVREYHRMHPTDPIQLFTTAMAARYPGLA